MNDLLVSLTGLSGFEFAHPMWFLILPLPLVVYYLVPAYRTKQMAIKVPFLVSWWKRLARRRQKVQAS